MQVSAGLLASSDGQLSVMCLPLEGRFSNGETPYTSRAQDIPKHVPLGVWLRVFHCLSQFETVRSVFFENDRLWGGVSRPATGDGSRIGHRRFVSAVLMRLREARLSACRVLGVLLHDSCISCLL